MRFANQCRRMAEFGAGATSMLGASSYHVQSPSLDKLGRTLKILHNYWMTCDVPEVNKEGVMLHTNSEGKLGERFKQPI